MAAESFNWDYSTPQLAPGGYANSFLVVRSEGAVLSDPLMDTITQISIPTLLGLIGNAPATEAISANSFVNFWNNAGVISVRNANANDAGKFACGFALSTVAPGGYPLVQPSGINAMSYGGPFAQVWLSDTVPGSFTTTPPSATGSIVQPVGMAIPGVGIFFTPQASILL